MIMDKNVQMKIDKIVIGVLSIIVGIVALIESYDVFRLAYAFGVNGFHIYVGFIVGFIFICLGILSLMVVDKQSVKFAETTISLSSIAVILCFRGPELFTDLKIFAIWGGIVFIYAIITYFAIKKRERSDNKSISQIISQATCPYCHAVVDSDSVFCGSCGQKLPEQQYYCKKCGEALEKDDIYCPNCGTKR